MGILISNERNAKQAVRSEENKKVNRGPGSRAALRGRGVTVTAAAARQEKHSAEISFR